MKIVIIGGEKGSIELAKTLRKANEKLEIVILEKMNYMSYSKLLMPYFLTEEMKEEDLMYETLDEIRDQNIDIRLGVEVVEILHNEKNLKILDTNTGAMYELEYDKLILTLGTISKKLKELNGLR